MSAVASWVTDQLAAAVRLAYAITGRSDQARRAVAAAASRVQRERLDAELPDERFRADVVRECLAVPPVRTASTGPLDELTVRQRAVLVLRVAERLTVAEIAAILDRPVAAVNEELHQAAGWAGLDQDGWPRDDAGRQSLEQLATLLAAAPDVAGVDLAVREVRSRRLQRRRRALGVIVAVAALASLAVLIPMAVVPLLPPPSRDGQWVMIHRVVPPPGWAVVSRSLMPTAEKSVVRSPDIDGLQYTCDVDVRMPGVALDEGAGGRLPARLRGHRGYFFLPDQSGAPPYLAWRYSPDAWATVTCNPFEGLERAMLVRVASGVRFHLTTLHLPFALSTIPNGYHIETATEILSSASAEIVLAKENLQPGDANISLYFTVLEEVGDVTYGLVYQLRKGPALFDTTLGRPVLCNEEQPGRFVCAAGYWPLGDWPARAPVPTNVTPTLIDIINDVRAAPVLGDRSTWMPATECLPR